MSWCTAVTVSAGHQPLCKLQITPETDFKLTSCALSTAYVMCKTGLSAEDAFQFVQRRRFCVSPRIEFQHQLEVGLSMDEWI